MEPITWLRPEYQGREDELIHLSAAADLVGVTRSAVTNWATRYQNFPRIVLVSGLAGKRTKHVVKEEFLDFARKRLNAPKARPTHQNPKRPGAAIAREQVERLTRRVEQLTTRQADQAAALKRTRRALSSAERALRAARNRLSAEINAVQQITGERVDATS
ncbi:hypothetical protein I5Q34_32610 [Streptomyces sp. AV19]|uniref:hypothetical protein n=1 Tax=Streptomyces sp. AV19 TaxID=2793068 RepID=UPI0018FE1118|nr:hypothetical protein [Streptomyces sp. AV19]MBH1938949.1 hypothetical protein [Streptomyces sp. AV19]MDG4531641.1 hypothetical protein [Streptomyces sp. AV19]